MSDQKFSGLAGEPLVLLTQAGTHCPVHVSAASFQRYWRREENPLETVLLFGKRYTSIEALHRFVERSLNVSGDDNTPVIQTSQPKSRDVESGRKKFNLPPSGKNGEVAK